MAKDKKTKEELTNLFLMYQSNMFPSLVTMLAEDLDNSVSEESINRLGVGFDYLKQAWVFAERNEHGEIIGLSLRYVAGGKGMVKGSRRGLTYECVAEIKKGKNPHRGSGFIPCRIAGVDCPVCGPEGRHWCMVSRDAPHNPSACICGRTERDSVKHIQGSGYLHKLRNDAKQTKSILSPLPSSDKPHPVVEGASDVLAAMDSGLVPVGKPSAEGGEPHLIRLLRDRDVVVMGEHDSGAGVRGMTRSAQQLLSSASSVLTLMPPVGYKDFRAWSPSKEVFTTECESNAKKISKDAEDKKLYVDMNWVDKAKILVASRYNAPKQSNLIYYEKEWWAYNGYCFEVLCDGDNQLALPIEECFEDYVQERIVGGVSTWRRVIVDVNFLKETHAALRRWRGRRRNFGQSEPFYLEGSEAGTGLDVKKTIIFKNGMLDVPTGRLLPLTKNLFVRSSVPYAYNKLARCDYWLTILDMIYAGDDDCVALLQEWFGYNLITSAHFHTMMFLYGVPCSGKSTITAILQAMVGETRCSSPQIDTVCGYTFGLEPLIGKYSILIDEEQDVKQTQRAKYLAFIKRITGQNTQDVAKKNLKAVHERLFGKVTQQCNKMLNFSDESQSMRRRTLLLKHDVSFEGHENLRLEEDLLKEIQGIAAWAVQGLQRLLENSKFTMPTKSQRVINSIMADASPIRTMIKDHWNISIDWTKFTSRKDAYDFYLGFCAADHIKNPCGAQLFRRRLGEAWPGMDEHDGGQQKGKGRGYRGVEIKPESMLMYLSGE